jgi:orotate phosphoribosyltransferase-like protein
MTNEKNVDYLSVIANLLAVQLVQGKSLGDASWLLRRAGMDYAQIAAVLNISADSVRALTSRAKKETGSRAKKKKVTNE